MVDRLVRPAARATALLALALAAACGDSTAPPPGAGGKAPVAGGPQPASAPSPHDWVFQPGALPSQDALDAQAEAEITAENFQAELDRLLAEIEADL